LIQILRPILFVDGFLKILLLRLFDNLDFALFSQELPSLRESDFKKSLIDLV
jgi:hypothetical protein